MVSGPRGRRRGGVSALRVGALALFATAVLFGMYRLLGRSPANPLSSDRDAIIARELSLLVDQVQNDIRRAVAMSGEGDSYTLLVAVPGVETFSEISEVVYTLDRGVITRVGTGSARTRTWDLSRGRDVRFEVFLRDDDSGQPRMGFQASVGSDPLFRVGGGLQAGLFPVLSEPRALLDAVRAGGGRATPPTNPPGTGDLLERSPGLTERWGDAPTLGSFTGPPFSVASAPGPVAARAQAGRALGSVGEAWIQFIAGGDEQLIDSARGMYRGRTSVQGDSGPPAIWICGNPFAEEDGERRIPEARGQADHDAVVAAAGPDQGMIIASVPGGLMGSPVVRVVSDQVVGAAGTHLSTIPGQAGSHSYPVPPGPGVAGGDQAGASYGSGAPGGSLPGDESSASAEAAGLPAPDPEAPPEQALPPAAPGPVDPTGASPGASPPSRIMVETAEAPSQGEDDLLDEVFEAAEEAGIDAIDPDVGTSRCAPRSRPPTWAPPGSWRHRWASKDCGLNRRQP